MEVGSKLKNARIGSGFTQEKVAEKIQVSRQTISNWENEKSYPDIISVIKLSDLYSISLDELLKGDSNMIKHLEESTNVVTSNKKLIIAIGLNVLFMILFIFFNSIIVKNNYLMIGSASVGVLSTTVLFYQIIKKF
ncbi:helix-turn-helix domain-containing protein [Clostridium sardiniense]|uniref:Helix-turn-helix domain-containing protein n=1 Tax=Clostridium sardiniense TaxID=29369 RepID=A0ABS7KTJ0_CLOSR|nr:helix-turn-helix domain-containing protein [Clostridium sardiniense]MBY0754121.1 helix-turn-helix domain-containing protein [Clostridium sardiniense]MDQ0459355.1 transcriptional regulator with XRE-family HTH domain [Clostridium sardiniense]